MMLLFLMINISFLSREVVGRITSSADIIRDAVQLTCTSDVNGSCTKGSWLSKTGVTLGSCIQGCKSYTSLDYKFHSNETSIIATIVKWNWTMNNSVWTCQCDADKADIVVTLPYNTITTVAPLLEHPTTTVDPLLENATSTTTSSSKNNTGPIIGGVTGSLFGAALIAVVICIYCFKKNEGRCLTRRRCCLKQKPNRRCTVSKVDEGQSEAENLMRKRDRTVLNGFDIGSAGALANDKNTVHSQSDLSQNSVINGDARSYSSENSKIKGTDLSDSKAESGRTLARQDFRSDQKSPDVEKDRSKVSTSSPVESSATSPRSQTSYQFHTDLKDGRELQKGSAGLPMSESEMRDQNRRSNWEKGEIDYMDQDSFSKIEQKLNESLNETTYPPCKRQT